MHEGIHLKAAMGTNQLTPRLAYSVADVVRETGLSKTTIYGLIASGQLASCKVGKRRIIRYVDLDRLISPKPEKGGDCRGKGGLR